jgi:molybdopterin synthase catalytic subunit
MRIVETVASSIVRRDSRGATIAHLEYEAYVEMAERKLRQIGESIERALGAGVRVAILHRVGVLAPGDVAVAIAAAAPHRAEAFDACRRAIERVETEVPIWKREVDVEGRAVWVGMGA